ncbi:MAG: endolytic transglycosylase MltG [Lachnospiraceae bacterium]|nr:endolytic transglycosylase MltG [Lachnospiraceae bacterium]
MAQKQEGTKIAIDVAGFIMHLLLNIVFYAVVIFAIYKVGITARDFCYQVFGAYSMDAEPGINAEITIKDGASTMEVAAALEMNRLIPSRYSFYLKVQLMGHKILAGTYILNTSMTYDEILDQITNYSNSIVQEAADE